MDKGFLNFLTILSILYHSGTCAGETDVPIVGEGVVVQEAKELHPPERFLHDGVPLIPKCCPWGETLTLSHGCQPSQLPFEPQFWDDPPPEEVDLLIGEACLYGRYRLEPEIDSGDEYHLLSNGTLLVPFIDSGLLSPYDYCLDPLPPSGEIVPYVCFDPPPPERKWKDIALAIYPVGCLISVPFLLLTVIIFMWVERLRDLHGKVLSCHSLCLASAYTFLAVVQLAGRTLYHDFCIAIAFLIQFSFLACFFWLNVLCFHTWWKMALSEKHEVATKAKERRRFIYYSLYAWLCPLLLLLTSVVMDFSPSIPSSYIKPNFGIEACWFSSDQAAIPYFYGPVAALLVVNVIFFLLTARSIHRSKAQEQDLATGSGVFAKISWKIIIKRRKKLFVRCFVLFCMMGLNWVAEVVSWAVRGPPQIWLVTDMFNTLQGLVVFTVFVVRDTRVRRLVHEKLKGGQAVHTGKLLQPVDGDTGPGMEGEHNGRQSKAKIRWPSVV